MDDKLKLILTKINLDEKYFSEFNNTELEKVIIYKKVDEVKIILHNQSNFSVDLYKSLINCFSSYFDKKVILELKVSDTNFDLIYDYYRMIIEDISFEKVTATLFIDRLVRKEDSFFVELYNKAEEKQFISFKNIVEEKLNLCGFSIELSTFIDEEESRKTKEEISNALKINVETLKVNKPVIEKKETFSSNFNKPK